MSPGVRRAKIDKLIGIILDAGLTQNGISDEPATDTSQSETIRTSPVKHIIRGLATSGARHELHYDGRISRNVFAQVGDHRSDSSLSHPAGSTATNESDGPPLDRKRFAKMRERERSGRRLKAAR